MDKQLTSMDEFIPTPTELKLIETMSNPENRRLSITDICKLAEISRQTYYNLFKNPDFVRYYNEFIVKAVKTRLDGVINAMYEYATTDPRAYQDRKTLLEIFKVYQPKQAIDVTEKHVFFSGEDDLED